MNKQLPSLDHAELVRHVGSCFEDSNFKQLLEAAHKHNAVVFFTSIVHEGEGHVQPILMPVHIANPLMKAILETDLMSEDDFADYITKCFYLMQLNSVNPAPLEFHFRFLEMFEQIMHNGMSDMQKEVNEFTDLSVGSLAVIQVELSDQTVTTGIKIIPNALAVYESIIGSVMISSATVH